MRGLDEYKAYCHELGVQPDGEAVAIIEGLEAEAERLRKGINQARKDLADDAYTAESRIISAFATLLTLEGEPNGNAHSDMS